MGQYTQAPATLATVTPAQARALRAYARAFGGQLAAHQQYTQAAQNAQASALQRNACHYTRQANAVRQVAAKRAHRAAVHAGARYRAACRQAAQAKAAAVQAGVPATRVHALAMPLAMRAMATG